MKMEVDSKSLRTFPMMFATAAASLKPNRRRWLLGRPTSTMPSRKAARKLKGRRMVSERQLRANRANSKRSTGSKTAASRAAAAGNARRHGLRIAVLSDPALSAEVEVMAKKIAGATPNCSPSPGGSPHANEPKQGRYGSLHVLPLLRARDEITESKEKNPAAGRNAGKESGVYA